MDSRLTELFDTTFVRGGREIKTGLDCQGLLLKMMEIYNFDVKEYDVASYATEVVSRMISDASATEKWEKISSPEEGCVVVIALDPMQPDKAQHLGVYIGEGKFIHILKKRGVLTSRINDRFFAQKLRGFYKWKKAN